MPYSKPSLAACFATARKVPFRSASRPGNGFTERKLPKRSRALACGRTKAVPSDWIIHSNRCRGFTFRASRTACGTVVCPLSVNVELVMGKIYHKHFITAIHDITTQTCHYRNIRDASSKQKPTFSFRLSPPALAQR
jgi:hypothetical protein